MVFSTFYKPLLLLLMAQLASGKKCHKIALVCPKLWLVSEVWDKYGTWNEDFNIAATKCRLDQKRWWRLCTRPRSMLCPPWRSIVWISWSGTSPQTMPSCCWHRYNIEKHQLNGRQDNPAYLFTPFCGLCCKGLSHNTPITCVTFFQFFPLFSSWFCLLFPLFSFRFTCAIWNLKNEPYTQMYLVRLWFKKIYISVPFFWERIWTWISSFWPVG